MTEVPRLLLAAPGSGAGKTTVTLSLLAALKERGEAPAAFKCGPDYIDPMFHREVLGVPSRNLDLFFTDASTVRGLLRTHAAGHGLSVLEGVMGFYDGLDDAGRASTHALAMATGTPVVLVISAKGAFLSLAALIRGFQQFKTPNLISGLILNHCTAALYDRLRPMLERETGLPCFGYLPPMPDCSIPSRHLGLVTAPELKELRENIRRLGLQAGQSLDLDGLLRLGHTAEPLSESLPAGNPVTAEKPRIAVARDEAFCFYYPDNLDLLERLGARLVPFSPLRDAELPATVSGLYLGGGYPELHAAVLSENGSMRESIRRAVASGLPTLAECGGFLYLQETLEDENGIAWPMANVLPGKGYRTCRLQRFGYLNLTPREDSFLLPAGESIPSHEFHYWDSTETGEACLAVKPDGRSWSCVKAGAHFFAGFPHLYFYGNPAFAARFVQAAAAFGGPRLCDD